MAQPLPNTPDPAPALVVPQYELAASRRGLIMRYGKLVEHAGRLADLPAQPTGFHATRGTYWAVSQAAIKLNEAQIRSQYLDYLYAPEPVPESVVTV